MKIWVFMALVMILPLSAEDWTTTDGKTYQGVTVVKVEADAVTILDADGGAMVPLSTLPAILQKRFNYDPVKAKIAWQAREHQWDSEKAAIKAQRDREAQAAQKEAQEAQAAQAAADATASASETNAVYPDPSTINPYTGQSYGTAEAAAEAKKEFEEAKIQKTELDEEQQRLSTNLEKMSILASANYNVLWFSQNISGELFITTQLGLTIKLSGIDIGLYPKEEIKQWLEGVDNLAGRESSTLEALVKYDPDNSEALVEQDVWSGMDKYVKFLPRPIQKTSTDADGKFDISVPKWSGDYYLVAVVNRSLGDYSETDLWIVPADPSVHPFLLDDNNLMTSEKVGELGL